MSVGFFELVNGVLTKRKIAGKTLMDAQLNANSRNGVQNRIITGEINDIKDDISTISTHLNDKVDKFKTKTISNATTNAHCAIELGLPSSRVINIRIESTQYVAFLITCGNAAYAAVYSNTPGYSTPVYNTNIGKLHITYV
jgi:hypothetical protein